MSYYTGEQALEMVLQDDLDSGGEIDIEEDPDFPLPHSDSNEPGDNSDSRRPSPDHGPGDSHNSDIDLDDGKLIQRIQLYNTFTKVCIHSGGSRRDGGDT